MTDLKSEQPEKARAEGMFIVHAPSNCMAYYEGHPARVRAQQAPKAANLPPWAKAAIVMLVKAKGSGWRSPSARRNVSHTLKV